MHDKLGNLDEAVTYYHRARLSLSSLTVPKDERGMLSRRKRRDLLKQVQQQLEAMPRTHEPKVGEGVRLSEVQSLPAKLWEEAEQQLRESRLQEALVSFEQTACGSSSASPAAASIASSLSLRPWRASVSCTRGCRTSRARRRTWARRRGYWRSCRSMPRRGWRRSSRPSSLSIERQLRQ